jgi:ankyrin repeat protein
MHRAKALGLRAHRAGVSLQSLALSPLLLVAIVVASLSAASGTTLIDAVKAGDRAAVRTLLTRSTVNTAGADGMTALHWAVRADDVETTQLLIRTGANAGAANRYGVTPLSLAATNGNAVITRALIKAGANANAIGPDGETVLMIAARAGNADVVSALVSGGANVNAVESWQGQTALMWAAAENRRPAHRARAPHGADLNVRSKELNFPEYRYETNGMAVFQLPKGGWTALMYAARQNAMDAAAALADVHADLNATTKQEGTTALQIAIINIHYDLANLLLDKGANPNVVDNSGMTALYAAVDMRAPANMLTRPEPKLRDTLDALGIVKSLLAHGANPNIQLKKPIIGRHQNLVGDGQLTEGSTALARAAKASDIPVMKVLLDGGADATLTLANRSTTAILAAGGQVREPEALEAVKLLVDHGVDVNAFNTNGQTLAHIAAQRGQNSMIEYLASQGAKLDRRDKQGRTPLDLALGAGGPARAQGRAARPAQVNEKTAALLRELMAQRQAKP